jgi:Xaa-Pro aminopeptidase
VQPAPTRGDGRDQLHFETLTWVPLDRRLIVTAMLSPDERGWIDTYHAQVLKNIAPRVAGTTHDWLKAACAPL